MEEYIVAIDLGSSKIAGMVAQRSEVGQLQIVAVEAMPSSGVRRGLVNNHSAVAGVVSNVIKKLQNRLRADIGKVYIGRGGHSLKTLANKVPFSFESEQEITDETLQAIGDENKNIATEKETLYEIIGQEFIIDGETEYNPLGITCSKGDANYLLVVGKPSIDKQICSSLERVPLKLADMYTAPLTTAEVLVTQRERELGCVVIDFGAETTSVVVYYKHFVRSIDVIPLGGNSVTNDICSLRVTREDAEMLKKKYGYAMLSQNDNAPIVEEISASGEKINVDSNDLVRVIEARMDEIMDIVCEKIYDSGYGELLGGEIIITGGASQLRGLEELIELKSGMKVKRGDLSSLLQIASGVEFLSPENAVLVGLINFGTDNCCVEKEVAPVLQPTPEPKKRKRNPFSGFREFVQGSLFEAREDDFN